MAPEPDMTTESASDSLSATNDGLDRSTMLGAVEHMLRDQLPLHQVDQYLASVRDLVEFRVFVHHFDENRFRSVNMWSINLAEAAGEALRAFEHDGWLVTNVIRVSDNPYMNEDAGSDDEMDME